MVEKSRGLGDDIKAFTDKTGISKMVKTIFGDDCGCDERQRLMNERFPNFKNIRPFTKDEKKIYEEVMPSVQKGQQVTRENQFILGKIYKAVFNAEAKWSSCNSCNKKTMDNLQRVYEKSCEV
jgi:hypothetical protein|tara:strand:- start:569 stop:937 length:369 start_codon:yes stop_codon:yes gene_type:complete